MTFRGRIENGVVRFDGPVDLPNGTEVDVQPARSRRSRTGRNGHKAAPRRARKKKATAKKVATLYETLKPLIGKAKGLPRDFARNHDHYIHGAPKR